MEDSARAKRVPILAWALYDFANTIFAMNVISRYFPLWVTIDKAGEDIIYGLFFAISMALAGLFEPVVGAVSDIYQRKRPFLIFFTLLSCILTFLIGLTEVLILGLLLFLFANFGYQLAGVFYNALLVDISSKEDVGRISGLGVGLGYLGTISGLLMVWPFVVKGGRQAAFVPTGILFLLFSIPCFIFVKERKGLRQKKFNPLFWTVKNSFARIKVTFLESERYPGLTTFLLASFCFLIAVSCVIIFMSIYTKKVMGFSEAEINIFYIVSSIFPVIGSISFGFLVDRFGPLRCLKIILGIWLGSLALAAVSWNKTVFWLVGPLTGICLGSTWVVSKALVIYLCPEEKIGEIFGLFGLVAKGSSIVGALCWGTVTWLFRPLGLARYRLAILAQMIFIVSGWLILRRIPRRFKA